MGRNGIANFAPRQKLLQHADMSTQPDPPCSATDRAAIIAAARDRARFIRWLSVLLASPRWDHIAPQGQDTIRAEVRSVLEQMTEGC